MRIETTISQTWLLFNKNINSVLNNLLPFYYITALHKYSKLGQISIFYQILVVVFQFEMARVDIKNYTVFNGLFSMIFVLYLHQEIGFADILLVYAFVQLLFLNHLRHHHTFLLIKVAAKTFVSQVSEFVSISFCVSKRKHCPSCFRLNRFESYLLKPIYIDGCRVSGLLYFFFLFLLIFLLIFVRL